MSKIICDVCGTSYPETATQCPICGCVRPVDVVTVNNEAEANEIPSRGNYTYVKGGRFSKSNVKKRNSANHAASNNNDIEQDEPRQEKGKSDKGLIIAVCILLAAIVAVSIYIAVHFFGPGVSKKQDANAGTTTEALQDTEDNEETTAETTAETLVALPCEDILLPNTVVEFDKAGAANLINYTIVPETTSDVVTFASSDETVATVDQNGKIESVGPGEAVITIRCGEIVKECRVICMFDGTPEETTSPTTESGVSSEEFKLNREDFTLTKKGAEWNIYDGDIPVKQIAWTSDNEKVATIKDGVVTAVGAGITTVHGEYNGTKLSCTVRCAATVGTYVEPSTDSETESANYNISLTDVTISVGEVFTLKLLDLNYNAVDVIWSVENESICSASGNNVTGLASGITKVFVVYEGVEHSCTVRVK